MDVLHRMVAPDWDEVLEMYAPPTSFLRDRQPAMEAGRDGSG